MIMKMHMMMMMMMMRKSPGESGSSDDQAKPKRRARKETHLFDLSLKGVMFNNYYYCWM